MKILMLSETPLVGAPYRMASLLNLDSSINCKLIVNHDYSNHLRGLFLNRFDISFDLLNTKYKDSNFDIIWVHNFINYKLLKFLKKKFKNSMYILHVHSPSTEEPLFSVIHDKKYLNFFDDFFIISQIHPRLYPDFKLIPNVVFPVRPKQDLNDDFILRVLFSPTSINNGRFSDKGIADMDFKLSYKLKKYSIDLKQLLFIKQTAVMCERARAHINIDDFKTGGFHQVSIEALASGGIALNNSDIFSDEAFSASLNAPETPPFIKIKDPNKIFELLTFYRGDKDKLEYDMSLSYSFAKKYMDPLRLLKIIKSKISL